jgi:hypothetical protein
MYQRTLSLAVLSASMLLTHARAEACAAAPVSIGGGIGADAQRIFVAAGSTKTEIVVEVTVPRTNEDYGILIPVPARPDLDSEPVEPSELDALEQATAPQITDSSASSGGVGCGSAGLNDRGGNVIETVEIGPLTVVALTASSSVDLQAWLDANNFNIPPSKALVLERYARDGGYFIAARRNDRAATDTTSKIGVHFTLPGQQLVLPLPAAQLGGSSAISFVVFVVSPDKVGPMAPYATLTLDQLDKEKLKGTYRAALESAVAQKSGRAFIVESVIEQPGQGLLSGRLAILAGNGKWLTRMSSIAAPTSFTDDLVIAAPAAPATVPVAVDVGAEEEGGCRAASGKITPAIYLMLFAAYWQLRRRAISRASASL